MKAGEIIKARTHAELINYLKKTDLKGLFKCTYDLDENTFIWMVSLNNTSNAGHRNKFENDTTIIEQFDKSMPKNKRFYHGINRHYRLVFEKIKTNGERLYKFHGLYKLVTPVYDEYTRTLRLINMSYDFNNL